jgi:branched-chain amino acid transport system permease protein
LTDPAAASRLVHALTSGVLVGGLYAIVALGLSLVLAMTRALNLAHGDLVILGGYVAYALWHLAEAPPLVAAVGAAFALVPLGLVWRHLMGMIPEPVGVNSIAVTFALSLLLQTIMTTFWRGEYRLLAPPELTGPIHIGPFVAPGARVLVGLLAVAVLGGLAWALAHTRWGRALRATSVNPEGAALVGIDTSVSTRVAFVIAAGVAGAAGALFASLHYLHPVAGIELTLIAIILTMWATAAHPLRLLGAGIAVGVLESLFVALGGPAWREPGVAAILLASLLLRGQALNLALRA